MFKQLTALLSFCLLYITLVAQSQTDVQKGYGKASYDATQQGTFMKSWLMAGPVAVSADSMPDGAIQQTVFKEDLLSKVKVVPGLPVSPVSIKRQNLQW